MEKPEDFIVKYHGGQNASYQEFIIDEKHILKFSEYFYKNSIRD